MKKTALLAIAIILAANIVFAADSPNKAKTKILNVIKREMQYPAFAKDKQIEDYVLVRLSVNEKGNINVKQIYSKNNELKAFVLKELESIVIKDFTTEQTLDMKIIFKVEKI
jgi:hypothetical protein